MDRLSFQFEGFAEVSDALLSMSLKDKDVAAGIRDVIDGELEKVRKDVASAAEGAMKDDPRGAVRAVRRSVYKKIFGGNVSILGRRKAKGKTSYKKARTLKKGQWGGNRRKVSEKTKRYESYDGGDRGFILRWVNSGVKARTTKYGKRGSIAARQFFTAKGDVSMQAAADAIALKIEELITERINNG